MIVEIFQRNQQRQYNKKTQLFNFWFVLLFMPKLALLSIILFLKFKQK